MTHDEIELLKRAVELGRDYAGTVELEYGGADFETFDKALELLERLENAL